ncbi:MAG: DEAD/DEAH box helicase, partial [Nitrospirae bacterium]
MNEENRSDSFDEYGFSDAILKGIHEAGFRAPSPIQKKAIPLIMEGRDLIGRAQTGTGKTAAFGLPAMDRIHREGGALLVITPTRELASQVSEELYKLGRYAGIKTVSVYGGQPINRQAELINRGAQVVTATPGRLLDHLRSGRIKRFRPTIVVLDEGDEMLDMGFINDIEMIFHLLPEKRQTMLFSATIPNEIKSLAERILQDPVTVDVTPVNVTPEGIKQRYYVIQEREREAALIRLIDAEVPHKALVFCRTKKETDQLSTTLVSRGYSARALHGDMSQTERNRAINSFRKGDIDLLVATDVAARGLDITDVTHVFNYHIPFDPESYVHRIG